MWRGTAGTEEPGSSLGKEIGQINVIAPLEMLKVGAAFSL